MILLYCCCAVTDPTVMAVVGNDSRNVLKAGAGSGYAISRSKTNVVGSETHVFVGTIII